MRSDDPDPCPTSLVMSPGRRCFGQSRRRSQKPNCRSPVQGLQRHLPSRCSVRAKSRDGNTLTCGWAVTLKWFCSRVPSARGSPLFNLSQREAEGEGSHAARQETARQETGKS
jgi:hypothetical protein